MSNCFYTVSGGARFKRHIPHNNVRRKRIKGQTRKASQGLQEAQVSPSKVFWF